MRTADQEADFERFLSVTGSDRSLVVSTWRNLETYRQFVPSSATSLERQKFLASIRSLAGAGLAAPGRGYSLGTGQVAQRLGVTQRTIRNWARRNLLPAVKAGKQWRFNRDDVDARMRASGAPPRD